MKVKFINSLVNIYDERAIIFKDENGGFYIRFESTMKKTKVPSYSHACNVLLDMGYHF